MFDNSKNNPMQIVETVVSGLKEKANLVGHEASEKGRELIDETLKDVGGKMSEAGASLEHNAPEALSKPLGAVADKLQDGGKYLSHHNVADIADDIVALVRKYPVMSVSVGVGLGFLLGAATSSRR